MDQKVSPRSTIDIHRIRKILPHRYPFLLIDKVLDFKLGESLSAIKNVSINEPFFQGHFPNSPVLPGVIILEIMAQASALLASHSPEANTRKDVILLFAGVDKARFKRIVIPGDQMIITVIQNHYKCRTWKCSTQASVDGKLAASAEVLFTYRKLDSK